ncbi:TetR/AcrR family transcriptional regulator [Rhodococcus spelaei]|uniref:TetR/AcrR family transcriptional regulator n=1 Tax=Rhodococcus spelaei TaxID=2546320 RepID=A0A541BS14_9NOCA|nr:TetR/AcrR family transcriptional regulator [Rhodococcus spelaei]TQF75133.1 TetR/AcrR family transcriptional regulator [Rhodococcus spelaei]
MKASHEHTVEASGPGRPRDPQVDRAVLEATVDLLVEAGYQKTTIQAIARRAQVSAPAIYRRWATREMIIEDAIFGLQRGEVPLPPATDDLRADLLAWIHKFLDRTAHPAARSAIPGLLSAYHHHDGVHERIVQRAEIPVRAALVERILQAVPTAGANAETTAETVFDILLSATMIRGLAHGYEDADAWCERLADALDALIGTIA